MGVNRMYVVSEAFAVIACSMFVCHYVLLIVEHWQIVRSCGQLDADFNRMYCPPPPHFPAEHV